MRIFVRIVARAAVKRAVKEALMKKTTDGRGGGGALAGGGGGRHGSFNGSDGGRGDSEEDETEETGSTRTSVGLDIPRGRSLGISTTTGTTTTNATTAAAFMGSSSPPVSGGAMPKKMSASSASPLLPFHISLRASRGGGGSGQFGGLTGDSFSTSTSTRDSTDLEEAVEGDDNNNLSDEDTVVPEPGQPTPRQARWIAQMTMGKDPKTIERFEKYVSVPVPVPFASSLSRACDCLFSHAFAFMTGCCRISTGSTTWKRSCSEQGSLGETFGPC
jgi:hypothetical protein